MDNLLLFFKLLIVGNSDKRAAVTMRLVWTRRPPGSVRNSWSKSFLAFWLFLIRFIRTLCVRGLCVRFPIPRFARSCVSLVCHPRTLQSPSEGVNDGHVVPHQGSRMRRLRVLPICSPYILSAEAIDYLSFHTNSLPC